MNRYFREGLQKLAEAYHKDPKMGDVQRVEEQIAQNTAEVNALAQDIAKFQVRFSAYLLLRAPY